MSFKLLLLCFWLYIMIELYLILVQGMPGAPGMKMYSRDDLMNMKNFGGEDGDEEDEDDDDDEASFPSKLVLIVPFIYIDRNILMETDC